MTDTPKKLKSLEEHNAEHKRPDNILTINAPNGIACPKCGAEMVDDDRTFMLASVPPKYKCHCPACLHSTFRDC